ncbi:MAG: DeoR family transcriptional regulator [Candidatus Omnitrophota bacterium]|jgi:predicted ArsR family transcriptional regulator
MPDDNHDHDEQPILSLIQQIKDGTLNPKTLPKEVRQSCVEFLDSEGCMQHAQIAQFLKITDRTVRRDLEEIDDRNALTLDIKQSKRVLANMSQKAMVHHSYLMRLARSPDATIGEKAQAEFLAWRVLKEFVEKMQSVGYLPQKPQELISDIYHHSEGGDSKTYEQLKNDLQEIERVARETNTLDLKTEEGIKLLLQRIEKAEISEEIADLNKAKDGDSNNKEENNHEEQ